MTVNYPTILDSGAALKCSETLTFSQKNQYHISILLFGISKIPILPNPEVLSFFGGSHQRQRLRHHQSDGLFPFLPTTQSQSVTAAAVSTQSDDSMSSTESQSLFPFVHTVILRFGSQSYFRFLNPPASSHHLFTDQTRKIAPPKAGFQSKRILLIFLMSIMSS